MAGGQGRAVVDRSADPVCQNARTHTDAQVAAIAASIKEWGWTSPALVGEDGGLGPSKIIHAASIFLVALAVVLLMAPAAYHRIVYAGEDTQDMHRVGSILVTVATVPLALGLAGDIYVVMAKIAGSPIAGLVAGVLGLIVLIGLWHAYPLTTAYIRNRADR